MDKAEISIKLGGSFEAKAFKIQESFYQREIEQALGIIEKLINRSRNKRNQRKEINNKCDKNLLNFHFHETISVFGSRGRGKTSFMLTLKKYIEDKESQIYKNLLFLPMIEPGSLEDAEYFLVTLTSLICQQIHDCANYNSNCGKDIDDFIKWQKSLRDLCSNFIAIDSSSYKKYMEKSFQYPETLGNYAILQGCGGVILAEKFHRFIYESIEILRKIYSLELECLVLMIDDVDIVFDKAWIILENIRKYLTTPQLIVIAAGDAKLFKMIIRNQFFQKSQCSALAFEKNIVSNSDVNLIKDVESQYHLKIFPLLNRIFLPDPYNFLLYNFKSIECTFSDDKNDNDKQKFINLFEKLIIHLFNYPKNHQKLNFDQSNPYTFIIPDSHRVLLQLLRFVIQLDNKKSNKQTLFFNFKQFFINDLAEIGFDESKLDINNNELFRYIFKKLTNHYLNKEYYEPMLSLQPQYEYSYSDNKVILVLNALFCYTFSQNSSTIFDFWFKFVNPPIEISFLPGDNNNTKMADYLNYVTQCETLPDLCAVKLRKLHYISIKEPYFFRKGTGFIQINNEEKNISFIINSFDDKNSGLHPWILELKRTKKKIQPTRDYFSTWTSFQKNADHITLSLLSPFLFFISDGENEFPYIDFQRGISVICEIIKSSYGYDKSKRFDKEKNYESIKQELEKWHQLHIYQHISDISHSNSKLNNCPAQQRNPGPLADDIIMAVIKWLDDNFEFFYSDTYPIEFVTNIWKRTIGKISQLDLSAKKAKNISAGKLLNNCIIAFLHSILIEERIIKSFYYVDNFNEKYIIDNIDELFNNILELLDENSKDYNFFRFWLNCPFINSLLEKTQQDELEKIMESNFYPFTYKWEWDFQKSSYTKKTSDAHSTCYPILCLLIPSPFHEVINLDYDEAIKLTKRLFEDSSSNPDDILNFSVMLFMKICTDSDKYKRIIAAVIDIIKYLGVTKEEDEIIKYFYKSFGETIKEDEIKKCVIKTLAEITEEDKLITMT